MCLPFHPPARLAVVRPHPAQLGDVHLLLPRLVQLVIPCVTVIVGLLATAAVVRLAIPAVGIGPIAVVRAIMSTRRRSPIVLHAVVILLRQFSP